MRNANGVNRVSLARTELPKCWTCNSRINRRKRVRPKSDFRDARFYVRACFYFLFVFIVDSPDDRMSQVAWWIKVGNLCLNCWNLCIRLSSAAEILIKIAISRNSSSIISLNFRLPLWEQWDQYYYCRLKRRDNQKGCGSQNEKPISLRFCVLSKF